MSSDGENDILPLLIQQIEPGSRFLRAWPLKGGISAQMTALELERPGGERRKLVLRRPPDWVLKRDPHAASHEFQVLQMVQAIGVSTATPIYLDESGDLLPTPFLVVEFVEGQPDYDPPDWRRFVRQMAAQLAQIHRVPAADPALSFLHSRTEKVGARLQQQPDAVDDSLQEGRLRDTLQSAWPLPRPNPPVLLHGDFWPGNVLWRDRQIVAVVDWEEACVGDPLADLAVSRLDVLWLCGRAAMDAFTAHYRALHPVDVADLPYWDLVAALRPANFIDEWASWWAELGRPDITEQTMREDHAWFVAQAYARLKGPQ